MCRLDACAPDRSRSIPGPHATPGKRFAALELLIHSNSIVAFQIQSWNFKFIAGGVKTFVLHFHPKISSASNPYCGPASLLHSRLSVALLERLSYSLTYMEPRLGSDLRCSLSADSGVYPISAEYPEALGWILATLMPHRFDKRICGNPRHCPENSSGKKTTGTTHGACRNP